MNQLGNQTDQRSREADQARQQAVQDALSEAAAAVSVANTDTAATAESKSKKPLLAILSVFKRNNCIIARSLDASLLNEMAKIIETLDTPTSQVLLEVKILQITLGDEFESFFQFDYGDYSNDLVDSRINPGTSVYEGGTLNTLASGAASASTLGGVISFDNIQAKISLYESEGRANTISSPFLMCANNAKVNFFVGEEVPLRDDVTKETITIGDGETISSFIVEVLREELGTDLEISTFINEDNTVTMDIDAEISSPQYNITSIGLVADDGDVIDFPLDGQTKSEIESIVTAKSGQTIALGGIIRETVDNSVIKTPILGDIPLIKYLFRQENDETQKTETVIILTPHIINHPGLAGEETDQFLKRRSSHSTIIEGKDNLLTDDEQPSESREGTHE
jgi:type II secretory pathway component GspD/PulD (secretin)